VDLLEEFGKKNTLIGSQIWLIPLVVMIAIHKCGYITKLKKKLKLKLNAELHFFYKWMKLAMAKLMDVEMFLDVFKQN